MGLIFKPENHTYWLNGIQLPSVTQILSNLGFINNIDSDTYKQAGIRGKYVHLATEYLDKGVLDKSSISAEIKPYINAYQLFLREYEVEWELIEKPVCNLIYRYAGTLDRAGRVNGVRTLLDIKTTGSCPKWAELQTAGYLDCLTNSYERRVLILKPNDFHLTSPFTDYRDVFVFRSAATIYNWKRLNLGG